MKLGPQSVHVKNTNPSGCSTSLGRRSSKSQSAPVHSPSKNLSLGEENDDSKVSKAMDTVVELKIAEEIIHFIENQSVHTKDIKNIKIFYSNYINNFIVHLH